MNKFNAQALKPGRMIQQDEMIEIGSSTIIELNGTAEDILIVVTSETDSYVEVLPGDSVFSGGSVKYPVYYGGMNCIYLEGGRHVIHNSDGTNTIHLSSEGEGINGFVVQLG